MQSTTNYGLNIVEGTDIVNPLTQFNPNFTDIDSIMKTNADASIDHATCIKTGTVHAITRTNSGASVFRFTATGNWNSGDTMTVDGSLVSVYVSDGTSPSDGCFVINTEVLASIQGTRVTLYVNSGNANNISYDNTGSGLSASNVQDAVDELENGIEAIDQEFLKEYQFNVVPGTHRVDNLSDGDILLFVRNFQGFVVMVSQGPVEVVTVSGLTIDSYTASSLTFTKTQNYSGNLFIISKSKNITITAI